VGSSATSTFRVEDEGAGDRHALLLTAAELLGLVAGPTPKANDL
jgi:hypothetical protein